MASRPSGFSCHRAELICSFLRFGERYQETPAVKNSRVIERRPCREQTACAAKVVSRRGFLVNILFHAK
jgi:hypothetical protein